MEAMVVKVDVVTRINLMIAPDHKVLAMTEAQ